MTSVSLSWGAHERTRNFFYEKQMQILQGMCLEVLRGVSCPAWMWGTQPVSLSLKRIVGLPQNICLLLVSGNPRMQMNHVELLHSMWLLAFLYVRVFCPVKREGRNSFLPRSAGVMLFSSQISQHTVQSMSAKACLGTFFKIVTCLFAFLNSSIDCFLFPSDECTNSCCGEILSNWELCWVGWQMFCLLTEIPNDVAAPDVTRDPQTALWVTVLMEELFQMAFIGQEKKNTTYGICKRSCYKWG